MVTQFWVGPATQLGPPTIVQTIGVACAAYGRPKTAATANNLNNRRRISPPHRVLASPRQARPGFSERASSEHRTQSGTPSQEGPCEALQSTCPCPDRVQSPELFENPPSCRRGRQVGAEPGGKGFPSAGKRTSASEGLGRGRSGDLRPRYPPPDGDLPRPRPRSTSGRSRGRDPAPQAGARRRPLGALLPG